MTKTSIKADLIMVSSFEALVPNSFTLSLKHMSYIYYLLHFNKDQAKIQALIDFNKKVNIITLAYIKRLGFQT